MLNAAPMWRNGRRNGLKIRFREKRSMGSNPIIGTSEKRFYEGKISQIEQIFGCAQFRKKKNENEVDLPSIRQVRGLLLSI